MVSSSAFHIVKQADFQSDQDFHRRNCARIYCLALYCFSLLKDVKADTILHAPKLTCVFPCCLSSWMSFTTSTGKCCISSRSGKSFGDEHVRKASFLREIGHFRAWFWVAVTGETRALFAAWSRWSIRQVSASSAIIFFLHRLSFAQCVAAIQALDEKMAITL